MVYIDIKFGLNAKLSGKLHTKKKSLITKENINTVSTYGNEGIVLQEIISQTFNNLLISNKNSWQ